MDITDPEAALRILREFRQLNAQADSGSDDVYDAINHLSLLVNDIADALGMPGVDVTTFDHDAISDEVDQLIGKLERQDDYGLVFGPVGPTLAASGFHPWVWDAVANLWDDGHYGPAVHEAAKAVELHTQLKVGRRDLSGKKLYSTAFAKDGPIPGGARLRFQHIDRSERPDAWTSAHEGAQHLGMGCASGIRNPQAHPSENISEQEALEQLAALSVLARWVDECDVVGVADGAAGE